MGDSEMATQGSTDGRAGRVGIRLEVAAMALATAAMVAVRRLTVGPRRPAWSFQTELLATMVRHLTNRSRTRGVAWLRAAQAAAPALLPQELAAVRVEPCLADGVRCEWSMPPGATLDPCRRAVAYFHGGGYVIGSPTTHREITARIALGTGVPVLAVDYRLAPEHRFPAAHDDCLTAVRWLRGRGVEAPGLAIAGDSAGGALAIGTMLSLRDRGEPLPACAALLCPWVDPLADGGTMRANARFDFGDRDLLVGWIRDYAEDERTRTEPRLTALSADLTGLPPLLVQAGEAEILLDQIRAFTERASAAGTEVTFETFTDMFHDFQVTASIVPQGAPAVASIVDFVRRHLVP
jgi:epsilon-lactone hydrolase